MKIRNGFVSNSSSSSFVILGEEVELDDIDVNDLHRKTYTYIAETGMYFEAPVLAEINSAEMLDVLKRAKNKEFPKCEGDVKVYRAYTYAYDYCDDLIDRDSLPKKFGVFIMTAQQGSPFDSAHEVEAFYSDKY